MILAAQDTNPIPYPLEGPVSDYSAHIQQFDAFQKGQICLDLPSIRGSPPWKIPTIPARGTPSAYRITGIEPSSAAGTILTSGWLPSCWPYYPFYWITGSLPANGMICGFFALLAAVFLCGLVLELVRLFGRRVNLLLLLIGLPPPWPPAPFMGSRAMPICISSL